MASTRFKEMLYFVASFRTDQVCGSETYWSYISCLVASARGGLGWNKGLLGKG